MSVVAARGFRAAGVAGGLKSASPDGTPALDVALIVNDGPDFAAAGVFTTNRFAAAPVLWTRQILADGHVRAVVANSGGANACTGPDGFADTHHTAEAVADLLGIGPIDVAVLSTGLIGERLPMGRLLEAIGKAGGELSAAALNGLAAATAILTTDTVAKQAVAHADVDGIQVTAGGIAKGAGMLAPGMATMLSVITTDASCSPAQLADVLAPAVATSFNRIDSDGCMSTNDTVLLLASGASGVSLPTEALAHLVTSVASDLARQMVDDAEGASKVMRVEVTGAVSEADAERVGRAVTGSNLVKCALTGEDPNWGRILSAVGTTSAQFEPDHVDVAINGVTIARGGAAHGDRSAVDMSGREVVIEVALGAGAKSAVLWGNDLTKEYVEVNSEYST